MQNINPFINKTIAIIGAMDSEVRTLKSNMKDIEVLYKAGLRFHKGTLHNKNVIVVQSGIGKVNAALCTQILIDDFQVGAVINTGVAGGLYKELKIGDIVISDSTVEHDIDLLAFGYKKGHIPDLTENGQPTYFKTDSFLAEKTKMIADEVLKGNNQAYIGTIASGDVFISDRELKKSLIIEHGAYAVEMEGAAIAHVATLNNIPVTIIRAISDLASTEANVSYDEFELMAAENCARIVLNLIKSL